MNLLFFILLIILFLLFVPIPFKFDMHFSFEDYYIKIYGFTIVSKNKIHNKKNKNSKEKISPPIKKSKKNIKLKRENFKIFLSKLYHRHFKPTLYIDSCLSYSLNDAFKTAIFFGILNNINTPLYILINIIFKIKKFNFEVKPMFKDEYFLDYNTSSIFFLSLAELIYITTIIFKYLLNSKEVTPDN
ncbi:MAG TPA: hypothetical protein DG753_14440 [Clostridium sp.]|nr:hypothetical protein [Clostridium sp.]